MSKLRRRCRLADKAHKDVDLRQYAKIIIDTINETVPNKNPKVYQSYFSTDPLSQWESVQLGRALSKLDELKPYGKQVTVFRLFDGRTCLCDESDASTKKQKGGRMK